MSSSGLTLDAGALIAIERNDRHVAGIVAGALEREAPIAVPAAALAQVWRDGARQLRLARFMRSEAVEVVPVDESVARRVGELCAAAGTHDVVDASVVLCAATRGDTVVTSDPFDIRRLAPNLRLIVV
jgi:predicted nucleic acid-binding protein